MECFYVYDGTMDPTHVTDYPTENPTDIPRDRIVPSPNAWYVHNK